MVSIRVNIEGKREAIAEIELLKKRLLDATKNATAESGDFLQAKARGNFVGSHPPGFPHIDVGMRRPNSATGDLQRSIIVLPVVEPAHGVFSVTVGPTTIYARIIELGGTITPKEAAWLSWFSPWLGRRMYRKEVTLTGWPYLKPALDTTSHHMNGIYERHWTDAILA